MTNDEFLKYALFYASQGYRVFPVVPKDKKPLTDHGLKDATNDTDQIMEWWEKTPNANIGIVTGNGLAVIDLDIKPEKNGLENIKSWWNTNGKFPSTLTATTGTGGKHIYYRYDPLKHDYRNSVDYLKEQYGGKSGIDIRANGGYIVAPPSIHPNGNQYTFDSNINDGLNIQMMDETVERFLYANDKLNKEDQSGIVTKNQKSFVSPVEITEGGRNDTIYRLACSLQAKGLSDEAIHDACKAENEQKCKPPLPIDELNGVISSALSKNKGNTLSNSHNTHTVKDDTIDSLVETEITIYKATGECNGILPEFQQLKPYSASINNDFSDHATKFPIEIFPKEIRDMCESVAKSLCVDISMPCIAVLGVLSLCFGGSFLVRVKDDYTEPLNLYLITSARPSELKSEVIKKMTKPIKDYERKYNKSHETEIEDYDADLLSAQIKLKNLINRKGKGRNEPTKEEIHQAKKELSALESNPVCKLDYISTDVTTEALATKMQNHNGRASIISAEGSILQTLGGMYNEKVNLDVILQSWSNDPVSIERKTSKTITLDNPSLTICLFVQPQMIEDHIQTKQFISRGLSQRFLFSIPPSNKGKRETMKTPSIPYDVNSKYSDLIQSLLANYQTEKKDRYEIKLSDQSFDKWDKWSIDVIEEEIKSSDDVMQDYLVKLRGTTNRIACLLHLATENNYRNEISGTTMDNAIRLSEYFRANANIVLRDCTFAEIDGKEILKIICECHKDDNVDKDILGGIKVRDIHYKSGKKFKTRDGMRNGIEDLIERGYIVIYKCKEMNENNKFKPSIRVVLNPLVMQ